MIKKILKWFCVISLVLLIGQVSIGSDTVGSWYQKQVASLVRHVANEIKNTKVFSNLVQAKNVDAGVVEPIPNAAPPKPKILPTPTPATTPTLKKTSIDIKEKQWHGEEVTKTDRDRLMRLLK